VVTPPVAKPAAPSPGTLDAVPAVASVAVDGPLPDSEIRSSAERVLPALRDCYRAAAKQSNKTPVVQLTVSFVIDEGRAARDIRVAGDTIGASACIKTAMAKVRTRVAPDVGTAAVNLVVRFQPTK